MPYVESNRQVFYLGEPGSGFPNRGPVQEFPKLKEELSRKNELFKDPSFPASSESLFFKKDSCFPAKQYSWKRPKELDNNPVLISDGPFSFDSIECGISECWLACAFIAFAHNEKCFQWVVPRDQSFTEGYLGIFHFRIWANGNWIDVVIDDRLPVNTAGHSGENFLLNLGPRERIEFWQTLLVKAYAKLLGCYEAVYRSTTHEVMEDFTACITETVVLNDENITHDILMNTISDGLSHGVYLIGNSLKKEGSQILGLLKEHTYCITGAKLASAQEGSDQMVFLLKLYSPCKRNAWKGRYSRQPSTPETLPEEIQIFVNKQTKEICLSLEEFIENFANVELLYFTPESPLYDPRIPTESIAFHGEWIRGGYSAGLRDSDFFWMNPQYEIELKIPDDKDTQCTFIVQLSKKFRFVRRVDVTHTFAIYKSGKRMTMVKTSEASPVARSIFVETFLGKNKEVFRGFWTHDRPLCAQRVQLPPGMYIIAPLTMKDGQEGEYYLRLVSKKKIFARECKYVDEFYIMQPEDEALIKSSRNAASEKQFKNFKKAYVKATREEVPLQWHQAEGMINSYLKGIGSTSVPKLQQSKLGISAGFSFELTRSCMVMLDQNRDGVVDIPALKDFLDDLRFLRECYVLSIDKAEGMRPIQFNSALVKSGIHLPSRTINIILRRLLHVDGTISFNNFIGMVLRARWVTSKISPPKFSPSGV